MGHNEPIEHWGSAPGPRAPLIVQPGETVDFGWFDEAGPVPEKAWGALQSLITATGSHVTLGRPCVAPEEIRVTDEMNAAGAEAKGLHGAGVFAHCVTEQEAVYRAMAAVAPVEMYGPAERRIDALMAEKECAREIIADKNARIAALEADNEAHIAALVKAGGYIATLGGEIKALKAQLATFGPATPADLPDPPRRADGTLAPQAKPWTPPKASGDGRRIGG